MSARADGDHMLDVSSDVEGRIRPAAKGIADQGTDIRLRAQKVMGLARLMGRIAIRDITEPAVASVHRQRGLAHIDAVMLRLAAIIFAVLAWLLIR